MADGAGITASSGDDSPRPAGWPVSSGYRTLGSAESDGDERGVMGWLGVSPRASRQAQLRDKRQRLTAAARLTRRKRHSERRGGRIGAYALAEEINLQKLSEFLSGETSPDVLWEGKGESSGSPDRSRTRSEDSSGTGVGGGVLSWFGGNSSSEMHLPLMSDAPLGTNPWGPPGPPDKSDADDETSFVAEGTPVVTGRGRRNGLRESICSPMSPRGRRLLWEYSLHTDVLHARGVLVGRAEDVGRQSSATVVEDEFASKESERRGSIGFDVDAGESGESRESGDDGEDGGVVGRGKRGVHVRDTAGGGEEEGEGESSGGGGRERERNRDIFFFSFGCVVVWGASNAAEEERILKAAGLQPFLVGAYSVIESDDMTFSYDTSFKVKYDHVSLSSFEPMETLAVSYAFAQSVRLSVYEARVDGTIARTRSLPESLAATGYIGISSREISRHIGGLFIERHSVAAVFLDTPEVLWINDRYEEPFRAAQEYLDISSRVDSVNSRYDLLRELWELLAQQLEAQHSTFLEVVVILLIVLEVVMQLITYLVPKPMHSL